MQFCHNKSLIWNQLKQFQKSKERGNDRLRFFCEIMLIFWNGWNHCYLMKRFISMFQDLCQTLFNDWCFFSKEDTEFRETTLLKKILQRNFHDWREHFDLATTPKEDVLVQIFALKSFCIFACYRWMCSLYKIRLLISELHNWIPMELNEILHNSRENLELQLHYDIFSLKLDLIIAKGQL